MHEEKSSPVKGEEPEIEKLTVADTDAPPKSTGGWGWAFSGFSVLSDLQKAAEEISRNVCSHSNFDLILSICVFDIGSEAYGTK